MGLVYPSKEELERYKQDLLDLEFPYLPPMDNRWVYDMYEMFNLVHLLPDCSDDFTTAAANLFFKVVKNHRRYDGNKRSAICCLIFFVILNDRTSEMTTQEIEKLALEVAASKGNSADRLMPMLCDVFKQKIRASS